MKLIATLAVYIASTALSFADAAALTTTYQPLDGLDAGVISIAPVVCYDAHALSGQPTSIGLIAAANIPPNNEPKEGGKNLNLAFACGLRFQVGDIETTKELTLDASAFAIPPQFDNYAREEILRASLECLRLCLPDKLQKTPVTLKASDASKEWMGKIVKEFNAHNRRKVFFVPGKE